MMKQTPLPIIILSIIVGVVAVGLAIVFIVYSKNDLIGSVGRALSSSAKSQAGSRITEDLGTHNEQQGVESETIEQPVQEQVVSQPVAKAPQGAIDSGVRGMKIPEGFSLSSGKLTGQFTRFASNESYTYDQVKQWLIGTYGHVAELNGLTKKMTVDDKGGYLLCWDKPVRWENFNVFDMILISASKRNASIGIAQSRNDFVGCSESLRNYYYGE